jgi:hypothetical protein
MKLDKYENQFVSIDKHQGFVEHIEHVDDDSVVVVLDTLDDQFVTIYPVYEQQIKFSRVH